MAGEWRVATVSDLQRERVLLVEDGNHGESRPRPNEFVDEGVAFIRAADMTMGGVLFDSASRISDHARLRITKGVGAPGDVLLSHKGTVGKVALVPADAPPFVCSPQTTFWRTLDQNVLDGRYLHSFLRSSGFHEQLRSRAGETDMAPYVSLTSQRMLSVILPPIGIQRAIAHVLGTIDDKIDLLCRMNQTLEETARMLFKSWFVRSLGANAKHLPIQTLLDAGMLQIGDGYRAKNSEMASEGIPFARAGNVNNGFRFDDEDLLGEDAIRSARDKLSQAWDVVFTSKGTVGRFAVVYPTTRRFVYSPQLCFWRSLDHERLNPMFLLCWMRSSAFIDQVATVSGQTDMALYVNLRDQRRMRIALPTPAAQREFGHTVRAIVERVEINENQMATLAETRDTLLPKLLSGALRIPDVERFLASEVRS